MTIAWKPISEAPHDKTILVKTNLSVRSPIAAARWSDAANQFVLEDIEGIPSHRGWAPNYFIELPEEWGL